MVWGLLSKVLDGTGTYGAVVKRRVGKGFTRRIEHGTGESTSAWKSVVDGVKGLGKIKVDNIKPTLIPQPRAQSVV